MSSKVKWGGIAGLAAAALLIISAILRLGTTGAVLSIVYGAAALVVAVFALGLKSSRKPARDSEAPLQARDV